MFPPRRKKVNDPENIPPPNRHEQQKQSQASLQPQASLLPQYATHTAPLAPLRSQAPSGSGYHLAARENRASRRSIHAVPREVMARIFLFAASEQFWKQMEQHQVNVDALLPVSDVVPRVCRRWRVITMSSPALWSYIYFSNTQLKSDFGHAAIERQYAWIKKSLRASQALPLHVLMTIRSNFSTPDLLDHIRTLGAFEKLCAASKRWIALAVSVNGAPSDLARFFYFGKLLYAPQDSSRRVSFATLKSLKLSFTQPSAVLGPSLVIDAPLLKIFEFNSGIPPKALHLPWAQLTHVSMSPKSQLIDGLTVLTLCPLLEEFSFAFSPAAMTNNIPHFDPVQDSRLRMLRVTVYGYCAQGPAATLGQLFKNLGVFPKLAELHVYSTYQWHQNEFLEFLSNHEGLHSLSLRCDLLTEYELIQCLRALPSLRSLMVRESDLRRQYPDRRYLISLTDEVIQRLTPGCKTFNDPAGCLLPKLETLELEGSHFCVDLFSRMVEARWRTPAIPDNIACLDSVTLCLMNAEVQVVRHYEALDRLEMFRQEGMKVRVVDRTHHPREPDELVAVRVVPFMPEF